MLKLAVCDDDLNELNLINRYVSEFSAMEGNPFSVSVYHGGNLLLSALESGICHDIYILDIIMPFVSGMEIAQEIRNKNETAHILFLTSSPEYAVDSYEVNASSYLLKPVNRERLFKALKKVLSDYVNLEKNSLLIHDNGKIYRISYDKIEFVEVRLDKLYFSLSDGKQISSYGTMKDLERQLISCPQFVKSHRSFLINMDYIQQLGMKDLRVLGYSTAVPVSRSYFQGLRTAYLNYMTGALDGGKSL